MLSLPMALSALAMMSPQVWEVRVDLFDPQTGAHIGSETTTYAPDGRRLRQVNQTASGEMELEFLIRHDNQGRESEAWFWEGGSDAPWQETFAYSADGRTQTVTYFSAPGEASDVTEITRDQAGRERAKAFFRADGTQYGEEDVLWNQDGTMAGWDFRYLLREGGAIFRYDYLAPQRNEAWTVRVRSRDGAAQRLESQSLRLANAASIPATPAPFIPGRISTDASETSPSFSADGRVMVFARYSDWERKTPYLATLSDDGWHVEPIAEIGDVYNLALSDNGRHLLVAMPEDGPLWLYTRTESGWHRTRNLSLDFGVTGGYAQLNADGLLRFYSAEGVAGEGLYMVDISENGDGIVRPVYVPESGTAFDGFGADNGTLYFTLCTTVACRREEGNGVYRLTPEAPAPVQLDAFDYVWGIQPVPALGLVVFTDGDDILTLPLAALDTTRK